MEYAEKLYKFAMRNKCHFHLYVNPDDGYVSCFLYSKGEKVIDYWTRDGEGEGYFTVAGKQFGSNYDEAIKYYEKLLILDKETYND